MVRNKGPIQLLLLPPGSPQAGVGGCEETDKGRERLGVGRAETGTGRERETGGETEA